jgi:hypothetical protein
MSLASQRKERLYVDNSPRWAGPTSAAFSAEGKYLAVGRDSARAPYGPDDEPPPFLGDVLLFTVPD